jgi:4-hydroxy-3-polyprenylbenzoate decarboxylase
VNGSHYCFYILPSASFSIYSFIDSSLLNIFTFNYNCMAYSGLASYINRLEELGDMHRIKTFADPVLEIAEITDRITKNGGKALFFENTGTRFPLLINAFASDKRIAMALGRKDLDEAAEDIVSLFETLSNSGGNFLKKISSVTDLIRITGYLPVRVRGNGACQKIIIKDTDLSILPVLKCWPFDGGRFITLPMVHTVHPLTGKTNVGMYRMQILDKKTAAMHWQLHKTGANHFDAWKKAGKRMPVSVGLGGDPVYTYAATAPLPENIDEYILAGFLRKKKVKLVRCITNDLYVPYDADIVIEGYVDPEEEPVWEGPFGDHTGFYSLADWYPRFHVTCITHSEKAVYPATVVGIPPMEDAWLTKATEKIFLAPLKLALQSEIEDFHMPDAGVAHNLVIVKIKKSYPGQGKKVISSLFGAGQMMFTKYLVVVSGETNIRNYREVAEHIFENTDFRSDLLFNSGPLDVLDHASDTFSLGGKLGVDASVKLKDELSGRNNDSNGEIMISEEVPESLRIKMSEKCTNQHFVSGLPVMVAGVNQESNSSAVDDLKKEIREINPEGLKLIIAVDHTLDLSDLFTAAWLILGNSDPRRDIELISDNLLFLDGTIKAFHNYGFPRRWPNVVVSSEETVNAVDRKWESLNIGPFLVSPSCKNRRLRRDGNDEVSVNP